MEPEGVERKLAAILSADVVGYSRLMAEDEEGTVRRLKQHREIIDGLIATHHGRLFGTAGDSVITEFASPVEAVRCAIEMQRQLELRNAELVEERRMRFRIGVNLGDVVVEGGDLLGDGVNIAARVQALAEPGGICVSANVHEHVRNKLNLAYDDLGAQAVKNIPEPVRVYALRLEAGIGRQRHPARRKRSRLRVALATFAGLILLVGVGIWATWPRPLGLLIDVIGVSGPPVDPPLPDKPSIVVLPFTNMSGDPEQEYFSDGITDDLIIDLSSVPGLFVIPRNSAFAYQGRVDLQDVGRELGVRYVLEGNVRRAAERVRITAQLYDTTSGFNLWSERYDRDLRDIFAVQSEISEEILTRLQVAIREAELERIRRKPTDELTAYDLYLKGRSRILSGTRQRNEEARRLFEEAIELDPQFAEAYAGLSLTYTVNCFRGWDKSLELSERAIELSHRALELNPYLSVAYQSLVVANIHLERHAEAVEAAKRAVELDANDDNAYSALGFALLFDGQFVEALQSFRQALRLNPRRPSEAWGASAFLNFQAGRIDEAVELWERVRAANPDLLQPRVVLARHYERSGRHEEARAVVQEILRVNPDFDCDYAAFLLGGQLSDENLALLRKAGLP